MCRAMAPQKIKTGGCMLLLQSLEQYRLPFLRPRTDYPYKFSLVTRWNYGLSYVKLLDKFRDMRLLSIVYTGARIDTDDRTTPWYYTLIPSAFLTTTILTTTYRLSMFGAPTGRPIVTPPVHGTQYSYTITPMVSQTPLGSLLYQGGPSLQPPIPRSEDT
ncbi:hypothetical protein Goari_011965 [Gossypium aridum]|uniref:Uncharacterized protein n=1 Tax=Gossypium aridum TaxID=34290 RepID=A0A7J8WZ12_GOSAI|nr:hypothetical protein [Gossypium aridum]